jgi:hypothetical protein
MPIDNDDLNNFYFGLQSESSTQTQENGETPASAVTGENDSLLEQFNQLMDAQEQMLMDVSLENFDQTLFEMDHFILPDSAMESLAANGAEDVTIASASHVEASTRSHQGSMIGGHAGFDSIDSVTSPTEDSI